MDINVNYEARISMRDCDRIYQGFRKIYGYIDEKRLACIVSRRQLPYSINRIYYSRYEKRPVSQIAMDIRMGKPVVKFRESRHISRFVLVSSVSDIKPTTYLLVFSYNG